MKIKREFDGVEHAIDLTDDELFAAYKEQQFLFDKDSVLDVLYSFSDDEVEKYFGVSFKVFECLAGAMAVAMRRNINKYDMGWQAARDEAIEEIIRRYVEQGDENIEWLWSQFADVPINPVTECIEQPFLDFPAGTHREEVWKWFGERLSKGVAYLMYGGK